jgi:two-component system OmpR family response regulator
MTTIRMSRSPSSESGAEEPQRVLEGQRVLVVDDDEQIRDLVADTFAEQGALCTLAASPAEAAERLGGERREFDLVLLDVTMPGGSGWQVLERLRAEGDTTPVIFVTSSAGLDDRLRGLRSGADDYVAKPFVPEELVARAQAVLRRERNLPRLHAGDLTLDLAKRVVELRGKRIELSPREFELLRALMEARGRPLSRTELLDRVWDIRFEPGTAVVEVQVARLRRKIEHGGPPVIETIIGEGYRIRPSGSKAD